MSAANTVRTRTTVHVVVPDGVDDPSRPSGGNTYDSRICRGLAVIGWSVRQCAVPGPWPSPDAAARSGLAGLLAGIPDGAVVLLDGLIASGVPDVLRPEAGRLRLVVLVHLPFGLPGPTSDRPASDSQAARAREQAVLSMASGVVVTSEWTRRAVLDGYGLRPDRVHVAEPGVDPASPAPGTAGGGELLCVAAVAPHKGHDVLLSALTTITDLRWRCICVGTLRRDPQFVDALRRLARSAGIQDRVIFAGPLVGVDLDTSYSAADVLVLASRAETYGMVVTEALARGVPVIATEVGGLPEALGRGAGRTRPGLLVPPNDPAAFGAALRRWLGEPDLRCRLRASAGERRETLPDWSATSDRISRVLAGVAA